MLQFIPENLDLNQILADHRPDFTYHKDNFVHLLNLLTEVVAKNPAALTSKGYVPLNALWLKRIYNYKKHLIYLCDFGIIETDGRYIPGKKCIGYRFCEQYQTPVVPVHISKPTLVKSLRRISRQDRINRAEYVYLFKYLDRRILVNFEAAKNYLKHEFWQDNENSCTALSRYNAKLSNLLRIDQGDFHFNVNPNTGVLNTNLTHLGPLRNFVTFEGIPLVSVEISNPMPNLLPWVLSPDTYLTNGTKGGRLHIHSLAADMINLLPVAEIEKQVNAQQQEYLSYRQAVEGDFYGSLKTGLERHTGSEWSNRQEVESVFWAALCTDNKFLHQKGAHHKLLFRRVFPALNETMVLFKETKASNLVVLLKRAESILLHKAAERFSKRHPGVPIFGLRGGLAVPLGYEDDCLRVMLEEAQKTLRLTLNLKVEHWSEEALDLQNYEKLNGLAA